MCLITSCDLIRVSKSLYPHTHTHAHTHNCMHVYATVQWFTVYMYRCKYRGIRSDIALHIYLRKIEIVAGLYGKEFGL